MIEIIHITSELLRLLGAYWFVIPIVAVLPLAYKFFGWRGVQIVLTLGVAAVLYRKGGADTTAARDRADAERRARAIEERGKVDAKVDAMDPNDRDSALREWMRDN